MSFSFRRYSLGVRLKTTYCGDKYIESCSYFTSPAMGSHTLPRNRNDGSPTSPKQKYQNWKNSLSKLRQLIKTNFATGNDWYVGLTYNNSHLPMDDTNAIKQLRLFKDRLRIRCKHKGIVMKLIGVTERSKNGRLHHHVFISGDVPKQLIEKAWAGRGTVDFDGVPTDVDNIECIARYSLKAPLGAHKWVETRSTLVRPKTVIDDKRIYHGLFSAIGYGGDRNDIYNYLSDLYPGYLPVDYDKTVVDSINSPYIYGSLRLLEQPPRKKVVECIDKVVPYISQEMYHMVDYDMRTLWVT